MLRRLTAVALRATGRRHFAAPVRVASAGAGPVLGDAYAVPFQISREEARSAVHAWHRGNRMSPVTFLDSDRSGRLLRSAYVPFYVFEAKTGRIEFSGEVGRSRLRRRFDSSSNTYKQVLVTSWTPSGLYYTDGSTYASTEGHMQMYASYQHRLDDMAVLKGEHVASAVPYMETDMISGKHSVEPVMMPAGLAYDSIKEYVMAGEEEAANEYIKSYHQADAVQSVQLKLNDLVFSMKTVYMPVFIDEIYILGNAFNVYINGVNASVRSPRLYSSLKVGAALALPLLFFADALSPVNYLPPLYGIVALVAAAVGGRMFGQGPFLHAYFRPPPLDWSTAESPTGKQHARLAATAHDLLVNEYDAIAAARNMRDQLKYGSLRPTDGERALDRLGRHATPAELRDTFVRLAMQLHPSHVSEGSIPDTIATYDRIVKKYGEMRRGEVIQKDEIAAAVAEKTA